MTDSPDETKPEELNLNTRAIPLDDLMEALSGVSEQLADSFKDVMPQIQKVIQERYTTTTKMEGMQRQLDEHIAALGKANLTESIRSKMPTDLLFPNETLQVFMAMCQPKSEDIDTKLDEFIKSPLGQHLRKSSVQGVEIPDSSGNDTPNPTNHLTQADLLAAFG